MQQTIGELGYVHPYRYRIDSAEQPYIGWWVSPELPEEGCDCELCAAAREGRDVFLGAVSRLAFVQAGRLVDRHEHSRAPVH